MLFLGAVFLNTGCIVIHSDGWSWGTTTWTEEVKERIALPTTDLENIEVTTHNGYVHFTGATDDAFVVATKKAGGSSAEEAQKALEALEVYVEPAGSGTQRIGYRWKGLKSPSWNASVSFDIHAPSEVNLTGGTHNGSVKVEALAGNLEFATHNGGIKAQTTGEALSAKTHNGEIDATFSGKQLELETHNGAVTADLTACGTVNGEITTYNGGVDIFVGNDTSLNLDCQTHNGGIRCTAPLETVETTRHSLRGKIGSGDGHLAVETYNGAVRVKGSAG